MLMPVENFQQRRQDRLNEAKFTDQITQNMLFQEQSIRQERAIAEAELARLRSLDLEPEDQFKVESFLDKMQEGIKKKVKSKYTNTAEYLRTEFASDLEMMKSALLSSNEFKNGVHNKQVLTQYREDLKKGLQARGDIDLSKAIVKNPDGSEAIDYSKVNIRSFEDQLSAYRTGRLDRLDYKGGYKAPVKFASELTKQYGADRCKKQEIGNDAKIEAMGIYDGLDPRDALYELKRRGLDASPMFYKYDDQYDKAKYDLDMADKRSAISNRSRQTDYMGRTARAQERMAAQYDRAYINPFDAIAKEALELGVLRSADKTGGRSTSGVVNNGGVTGVLKELKNPIPPSTMETIIINSGGRKKLDEKGKWTGEYIVPNAVLKASNMRSATKATEMTINPKNIATFIYTDEKGQIPPGATPSYRIYVKADSKVKESTVKALGGKTNILWNSDGQKGLVRGSSNTFFERKDGDYYIRDGYVELGQTWIGDIQATKDANIKGSDLNTINPNSPWLQ